MIEIEAATVLLQWAVGGLLFGWVTTRRREVGLGYGWMIRISFGLMAVLAAVVGFSGDDPGLREVGSIGVAAASAVALWSSVVRRRAGVTGQRDVIEKRTARVAAMTGIDRDEQRFDRSGAEFDPRLDLIAPAIGLLALISAGIDAGDPAALAVARTLVGAVFLGVLTDAMLLGHWYLVQPGLARSPLLEIVRWTGLVWPVELIVLLWPTGMVSVINGDIDDGYNGLLGWFWIASTITTIILVFVTRAALRERQYAAVMAATGLLYLAILTGFGMDLVARVLLDT